MSVAARFYVREIVKQQVSGGINHTVKLSPVVRPTDDNKEWSKYTPSGDISMTVTQESAGAWFEDRLGEDVSITFSDPE